MAALPLANQVRQVYVVSSLKSSGTPSALGELAVKGETGKYLYFQHYGHGGLTASDRIAIPLIRSITQTAAADMKDKLKTHVVTVTTVSAGQVYEIKVLVHNFVGQGANDYAYRFGMYKAKANDTAATIAAGLAADLQGSVGLEKGADASNINNYKEKLFTVTVSGAAITISEVDQSAIAWSEDRFPVSQAPVEVLLGGIVTDNEYMTYNWATIADGDPITVNNAGKKMAELEWFAHGFRGDKYRGIGYPYTATTKYQVDPTQNYDCIDIHYAFQGKGISSQFSEKEITLIVPAGNTTIKAAITTLVGNNVIEAPETLTGTAAQS